MSSETTTSTEPAPAKGAGSARSDIEEIDPQPTDGPITIGVGRGDGGVKVKVNRLKTREFLALLRFLSRGLGPAVAELSFNTDDEEELAGEMIGTLIVALPEATDEFMEFVQAVVTPVGKDDVARVKQEMANPDIDDLMAIGERVVVQEIPDLRRLAGNAQAMWGRIRKVYERHQTTAG